MKKEDMNAFADLSRRLNQVFYGSDGTEQIQDPENPDAVRITHPNGDIDVYHAATGELLKHIDILDADEVG